jgi:phage terminase small subunit
MTKQNKNPKGLKQIAGAEHKRQSESNEVTPTPILECPPELGPTARQEWDRIVAELISKGVLSAFDRGPLAGYPRCAPAKTPGRTQCGAVTLASLTFHRLR